MDNSSRGGFTLIEVLTTIAIIGILASLTGYVYNASLQRSRDSQRKTDLQTIQNALEQYYLEHRTFPAVYEVSETEINFAAKYQLEQQGCGASYGAKDFLVPEYLSSLPEDPKARYSSCGGEEAKQYVYATISRRPSDPAAKSSPIGYYLLAYMERDNNTTDQYLPQGSAYKYSDLKTNGVKYWKPGSVSNQLPKAKDANYNYLLTSQK